MEFCHIVVLCSVILTTASASTNNINNDANHVNAKVQSRPLPPFNFSQPQGGFPGISWFGSNVSGWENDEQLRELGNYSMVIFGWQAFLNMSDYKGELVSYHIGWCGKTKKQN